MGRKLPDSRIVFFIALAGLLLIAGCTQGGSGESDDKEQNSGRVYIVEITSQGFNPNPITIRAGDTVRWINRDSAAHWIASANHPTHNVYPGSGIEKCGTAQESTIFDACRRIESEQNYSFTFNNKGEWAYHDHLDVRAPFFGKVIVE